jgi:hypothetical protein
MLPLGPDATRPIGHREIEIGVSYPLVKLYTGPLFNDRLRVARMFGGPHWIVSAFHGCRTLIEDTEPGDRLIVLASAPYVNGWRHDLECAGRVVDTPLKGLGIGAQRKRCRELRQMSLPLKETG